MGGDYALAMAPRQHGFSASSVNYGGAVGEVEQALPDVCPSSPASAPMIAGRAPETSRLGSSGRSLGPVSSTTSRSTRASGMAS